MIFVFLFLITTLAVGVFCSLKLAGLRGWAERLAVGATIGLVLQLWLPFLISKQLGGGIRYGPTAAAMVVAGIAAVQMVRAGRATAHVPKWSSRWISLRDRLRTRANFEAIALFCFLAAFTGWLFFTHSLRPTAAGLTSAGVSWEDQSGHAMYASSFLYSDNLSALENPHFSEWPLAYPFLCDFLAASLVRLGGTLSQAFWLSGWYACMTFSLVTWVAFRDWLGSARRASLALVLLLGSGGFGFVDFLQGVGGGTPWREMLMKHDYANAWELKLHYHNVLTAILLPMRSFLFGIPLALTALFLLWRSLERGLHSSRGELVLAGVLVGLMPLTNAHTLLITAWCGAGLALGFIGLSTFKDWARLFGYAGVPALMLAGPQLLWTRSQLVGANSFIRFAPGWLAEGKNEVEWASYWIHNAGVWVFVGLAGAFFASGRLKKITLPFLFLFVLGNLVVFQPLVYDNVKLFVFANMAIAALAVDLFGRWWHRSRLFLAVILPLVVLLTASGTLSVWRELKLEWVVVDPAGMRLAELVRQHSPAHAVFLTGSELTHPVPVLTGRPQVLGYHGWMTNVGIPLGTRVADVKEIYEGGAAAAELLGKYHVSFVVVGPPERREFPGLNEAFISQRAKQRWETDGYTLYRF